MLACYANQSLGRGLKIEMDFALYLSCLFLLLIKMNFKTLLLVFWGIFMFIYFHPSGVYVLSYFLKLLYDTSLV